MRWLNRTMPVRKKIGAPEQQQQEFQQHQCDQGGGHRSSMNGTVASCHGDSAVSVDPCHARMIPGTSRSLDGAVN